MLVALSLLWIDDSFYLGRVADRALTQVGYRERTTARNLWPRACPIWSYEQIFWAQGPARPEAQGYVCASHFRRAEIRIVPFGVDLGFESHP